MTQATIAVIKNKGGRPRNPDRHLPDGTYNPKPLDPLYFQKYYQQRVKNKNVECPRCGCVVNDMSHMSRHQKTKKCLAHFDSEIGVKLALLALTAVELQLSSEQDALP